MENFFEYFYENREFRLKYAHSAPTVSGEEYHDYCEIVIFLGGEVHFISTDIQQRLKAGSIVLIPQGSFHQFVVSGNNYTRCILSIHKSEELECLVADIFNTTKIIETPGAMAKALIDRLIEISKWEDATPQKAVCLRSVAVMLLMEIQKAKDGIVGRNINLSKPVFDAISIINNSYTEQITVEGLAKKLMKCNKIISFFVFIDILCDQ